VRGGDIRCDVEVPEVEDEMCPQWDWMTSTDAQLFCGKGYGFPGEEELL
jgi:hypothetical protein